jgi:hypothetical protein
MVRSSLLAPNKRALLFEGKARAALLPSIAKSGAYSLACAQDRPNQLYLKDKSYV